MTRRTTKQLNAISRSYTEKHQLEAREWIMAHCGFSFYEYAEKYDYKGSPCMLVNSITWKHKRTMTNVLGLIAEKYGEDFAIPDDLDEFIWVEVHD